jgi:hypothetical protein
MTPEQARDTLSSMCKRQREGVESSGDKERENGRVEWMLACMDGWCELIMDLDVILSVRARLRERSGIDRVRGGGELMST